VLIDADSPISGSLPTGSGVAQERTISLDGRKNLDARAMMDDPEISSALRWVIQDLR
jgi:hypothetical protein